ncbi:Protein SOB FIVE-LIKE 4 [Frankliniella fusca]|uniref:Protein SOB FIVE-LIKE 4 n=1 Tax=Frankliniella fusca TaxID=407009 RepID=A0AAE1HUJ6_9NEOP|nr:Protein SOB FIVE-LIKE 4 [Frankliniella fusca]
MELCNQNKEDRSWHAEYPTSTLERTYLPSCDEVAVCRSIFRGGRHCSALRILRGPGALTDDCIASCAWTGPHYSRLHGRENSLNMLLP